MKAFNIRRLFLLAAIAFAAPFLSVTLIVGARAAALTHGAHEDLLLVALAFGGAAASFLNGFGSRASKAAQRRAVFVASTHEHVGPHSSVVRVR
jgi:hypothetical protein